MKIQVPLPKKEFSRRDFLMASGALVVTFSAATIFEPLTFAQGPFDTHPSHIDPAKLDSWLAVAFDGSVTAYTGKCDFGQGMLTVQTQLVAEELCVPIQKVKLIQCDTAITPDQGTTSGSQSTPTNFNSQNLAQAAATAREALIAMAAQKLSVPADQLNVEDGVIHASSGRSLSYADLIGGQHFNLTLNSAAKRRSPGEWKVSGQADPLARSRRPHDRYLRIRSQRPRPRHGPWPRRAPPGVRSNGGEHRQTIS